MKLRQLRRTHCEYNAGLLQEYRDLFEGGQSIARNVDRYILKNDQEPPHIYAKRCEIAKAEYVNYCGPIGNYYASWLMTSPLTYKSDPEDVDEFYEQFKEDCDGGGADYEHFMRHRFVDALIDGKAFWRIEFPEAPPAEATPMALADWKANGLDRGVLVHMPASSVLNWKCDGDGYVWLVEYGCDVGLLEPDDEEETTTETWTIWRRDGEHKRYQIEYTKHTRPNSDSVIPEVEMPWTQGQISGIPIVEMRLPEELWMMNLIASPQLANWRKRVGLSWSIDRTCYAMPVFNIKNRRKPPAMGSGYYLVMGTDENAKYLSPDAASYDVVQRYLADSKDEIHRIVQQMARGVDNNAAAVGRSGDSKASDDQQTEIILGGFGIVVRDATEKTFDMLAEGRGENIDWSIGGMSNYHIADMTTFVANVVASQDINIPSPTYHREVAKRVAQGILTDVDESIHQQMDDEIDANLTDEVVKTAGVGMPKPPALQQNQDGPGNVAFGNQPVGHGAENKPAAKEE